MQHTSNLATPSGDPWQLFEAESREVEQHISKLLEGSGQSRPLRKPPCLKHRRLTITSNFKPADDHADADGDVDSNSSSTVQAVRVSQPFSTESQGGKCVGKDGFSLLDKSAVSSTKHVSATNSKDSFCVWTGHADSSSVSLDTLCAFSSHCLKTLRLKKSAWLRRKSSKTVTSTSSPSCLSPMDTCDDSNIQPNPSSEGDSLTSQLDRKAQPYSSSSGDRMPNLHGLSSGMDLGSAETATTNVRARTIQTRLKTGDLGCANLGMASITQPKSPSADKTGGELTAKAKTIKQTNRSLSEPSTSSVRDTDFTPGRYRLRKRALVSTKEKVCSTMCKDSVVVVVDVSADAAVGSACCNDIPHAKHQELSQNEVSVMPCTLESSSDNTDGILTRSKMKQHTASTPPSQSVHAAPTTTPSSRHHHNSHSVTPGPPATAGRPRRPRRIITKRKLNMLCVSCKHGFLSSECLLCLSVKTTAKRLVHKASSFKTAGKRNGNRSHSAVTVRPASKVKVVGEGRKKTGGKSKSKIYVHKLMAEGKRRYSSRLAGNSQLEEKQKHARKNAEKLKLTRKTGLRSDSNHQKNSKFVSSGNKQITVASKIKAVSKQNTKKSQKSSSANRLENANPKTAKKSLQTHGRNNVSVTSRPPAKKVKLSQSREGQQPKPSQTSDTCSRESQILEHHKTLSSQTLVGGSSEAPMSTKDMFSQLCELEERAKDYDTTTLLEVMPQQSTSREHVFSKPRAGMNSSSLSSSHVGGIWKSIFPEK